MKWPTTPLKRAASVRVSNVDKKSAVGDTPVRLCNYTDVYYRDTICADQEFMAATATADQIATFRLRPGDVVITKDSETATDIGVPAFVRSSAADLVCGYHLAIIRPESGKLDGRFLYWAMVSKYVRDQLVIAATGVTRFGLRTDSVGAATVPAPSPSRQRLIADFLDAETARIDALILKECRLALLLVDRWREEVQERTRAGSPMSVRHVTSLRTSGPRGWAERAGSVGEPFIRSANLQPSSLDLRTYNLMRVNGGNAAEARLSRVRVGDVVVGITGANTGWVGIVGPSESGGYVSQHVAILRPARVESRWLAYSLFARSTQEQLRAGQYGGTKQQLALDDLAGVNIHVPTALEQLRICPELEASTRRTDALSGRLARQVELLRERREALITAAVTGELEIPAAAA